MACRIPLKIAGGDSLPLKVSGGDRIDLQMERVRYIYQDDRPAYIGPYTVVPGPAAVTLATEGKRMTSNVIVDKIPQNYGLITWDGAKITVS